MSVFGKGNIKNNRIAAKQTRQIIADAQSYVRPDVLAKLKEKFSGEEYYLFLRNTPSSEWETEAEKILSEEGVE